MLWCGCTDVDDGQDDEDDEEWEEGASEIIDQAG